MWIENVNSKYESIECNCDSVKQQIIAIPDQG
jgi:hypothetical protein